MTTKTYDKICEMQKNVPYGLNDLSPALVSLLKDAHHSYRSDLENSAKYTNLAADVGEWIAYLQDLVQDLTDLHGELLDVSAQYGDDIMEEYGEDAYIDAHNRGCDYDSYRISYKHGILGYWDVNL